MLQLGLESADQEVLDAMGKGTELGEIDRILENLSRRESAPSCMCCSVHRQRIWLRPAKPVTFWQAGLI
jgi:hypothetical protein